jgi:hypothetical protein
VALRRAVARWSDFLPGALPGAEPARKQKAAGSSGESEHGQFRRTAACSRNWPIHSRQDPADAEVPGAYKSLDESPRHQRHRAKTAGQNAPVPDRGKTPPTKAASTKPVTPHRSPLPPKRRRGKRKSPSASLDDRAPVAHPFQGEGVPIGCGNHGMAALDGKPQA